MWRDDTARNVSCLGDAACHCDAARNMDDENTSEEVSHRPNTTTRIASRTPSVTTANVQRACGSGPTEQKSQQDQNHRQYQPAEHVTRRRLIHVKTRGPRPPNLPPRIRIHAPYALPPSGSRSRPLSPTFRAHTYAGIPRIAACTGRYIGCRATPASLL